jgi:hypothetical protein
MKIVDIHNNITNSQLYNIIREKLSPLFKEQRKTEIIFVIEDKGEYIEISQPELYEGFLFRIEIIGRQLHITRSEHYVDDVNSLTVESILYTLIDDLSGERQASMVIEG